ncbi:uncharacterized protein CDAR_200311 [Caerostris darwini]|uniref:Neurotransmitter-gated ion-channel transmembrane domain-containing protein n=1 Tax=Caerostris darwini TaxID=1538125 RepID=A0AAV4RMA4_9ARAC|nr:uncharacterized protein CDAR_200311 [Caerostris darwini]
MKYDWIQTHRSQLPPLNYIIALDIWLFVCIFMVFATLVEFAISYNSFVIKRVDSSRDEIGTAQSKANETWMVNIETSSQVLPESPKGRCSSSCRDVTKIDFACRFIFPLSFTAFSTAYWAHYLTIYNWH